jgi:hypothetical protein
VGILHCICIGIQYFIGVRILCLCEYIVFVFYLCTILCCGAILHLHCICVRIFYLCRYIVLLWVQSVCVGILYCVDVLYLYG